MNGSDEATLDGDRGIRSLALAIGSVSSNFFFFLLINTKFSERLDVASCEMDA